MYIPSSKAFSDSLAARWSAAAAAAAAAGQDSTGSNGTTGGAASSTAARVSLAGLDRLFRGIGHAISTDKLAGGGELRRRASSTDANLTVGIIVGVVLGLFLVGCFTFLWIYRNSIVFSRGKHRKRRKSSGSSKASSKASDSGASPPPAEGG